MRVISGIAKGRKLKLVPGIGTRPIMDRVKENLFNIIGEDIWESHWLDLFSGTGQVGIEALSRGASSVVFIDNNRAAVKTTLDNLKSTGLTKNARVLHLDAYRFLDSPSGAPFDYIYVAPPQYQQMWESVIKIIDKSPNNFLEEYGTVIVQIDPKEYINFELQQLEIYDQRKYGSTLLCFYGRIVSVT